MQRRTASIDHILSSLAMGAALYALVVPASAAPAPAQRYDMAADDLGTALRVLARTADIEIIVPTDLATGKRSAPLKGDYDDRTAVDALLRGTGLHAVHVDGAYIVKSDEPGPNGDARQGEPMVVTGSRIRGASPASPVIAVSAKQMRDAGQNNLGDVLRSIPQSFGGGQNPGVGQGVTGDTNINVSSGSSINLRGLGPDATLTLINGRRLTYNGAAQSVDISAIPIEAVARVEIVADGASALYGSDAVAGVANIILKRDYDGVSTMARFGASTDGGNVQQQYSATGGTAWNNGGLLIAYDFSHATPIEAGQRDYADSLYRTNTLLPFIRQHSALASGHQDILPGVELAIDALFSDRASDYVFATTTTADYRAAGLRGFSKTRSFVLAPTLKFDLPAGWTGSLGGSYGQDRTRYGSDSYIQSAVSFSTRGCYCNRSQAIDANAEGPLFALPGGEGRLAFGGGYRSNAMHAFRTRGTAQNIRAKQDSHYAYGELFVPLIGPANDMAMVSRLTLSAAARYEAYPGIDRLITPKLGLVYAPTPDVDIKFSWGKSFKAPTLFQQYAASSATIFRAPALGGTGFPAGSTALLRGGGNPGLKPERATSWSATLALHPQEMPGLTLEASYFDIDYRDRIVQPIGLRATSLSDPIYRELVTYSPTATDKAAAIAADSVFNNSGMPYDAASIVAIVDNRYLNVARQALHGVDFSGVYRHELPDRGTITARASASYLESRRQLSADQPLVPFAGTLFNPPHWRARGGVTWDNGPLTLAAQLSYIGGVKDRRAALAAAVGSMTMLDLTARYNIETGPRLFRGVELALSVQNLLNDKPDVIATTNAYFTPYDSTNYSAVGRFVSVSVTKRW